MKNKKTLFVILVINILLLSTPIISSVKIDLEILSENCSEKKELHLLRVEHYLVLKTDENTNTFNVRYACPPIYNYQVPIYVHIFNDSTANIINYKVENETGDLNKFINFTIGSIEKSEEKLIHFTIWVLVENHDFSDLPEYVEFPNKEYLPSETIKWLSATNVSQKNNFLIKLKAKQLRGFSDNLVKYASRVAKFIRLHRYPLFLFQLYTGLFLNQDAITTLFINGENVGRSHLACALLRSQNIPTRVLLVNNDQGFWTQMHYMAEYYCPGYGWVLIETTGGKSPYETSRQVINRICYPEDENNTKQDYIFRFMKGEERWIWVDSENVRPYYIDCDNGSKSQMFSENIVETCEYVGNEIFDSTSKTFIKYQKYLGMNLSGQNNIYFENAINYQETALEKIKDGETIDYYYFITRAGEEFDKIII